MLADYSFQFLYIDKVQRTPSGLRFFFSCLLIYDWRCFPVWIFKTEDLPVVFDFLVHFVLQIVLPRGDCSPCPPVWLMPSKVLRKKESRRSPNSHLKQCRTNTQTRRSSRRCWGYRRQARPQGSPC